MTGSDELDPLDGADPVAELEAFIAQTEARGEPVPPEARVMLERLRELMTALRELRASFDQRASPPSTSTDQEESEGD